MLLQTFYVISNWAILVFIKENEVVDTKTSERKKKNTKH